MFILLGILKARVNVLKEALLFIIKLVVFLRGGLKRLVYC